jgi:hypothetical protein
MIDVKSVLGRNGMKIEFGKQVTMKILTHNLSSKYRDIRVDFFLETCRTVPGNLNIINI